MPLIYPTLIGQTFPVIKRPIWNTVRAVAASGKDYAHSYWTYPTWEWDIPYDYLPDAVANGTTANDLRTLIGFFNAVQGDYARFLFRDPDFNSVTAQYIGVGNGTQTVFTIINSFGLGANNQTEPTGFVNTGAPVNVYFNGTLQTSGYGIVTTVPMSQTINFTTAPASSVTITMDYAFWYWCRFKDPTYDFEKFADKFWDTKKVTVHSVKNS
jgi:uncharacterized protein (TIGR02217 family)